MPLFSKPNASCRRLDISHSSPLCVSVHVFSNKVYTWHHVENILLNSEQGFVLETQKRSHRSVVEASSRWEAGCWEKTQNMFFFFLWQPSLMSQVGWYDPSEGWRALSRAWQEAMLSCFGSDFYLHWDSGGSSQGSLPGSPSMMRTPSKPDEDPRRIWWRPLEPAYWRVALRRIATHWIDTA